MGTNGKRKALNKCRVRTKEGLVRHWDGDWVAGEGGQVEQW